jgi:hypothetical protein
VQLGNPYPNLIVGDASAPAKDLGKLDNTLIIYVNGDNGTSAEAGRSAHPTRSRKKPKRQALVFVFVLLRLASTRSRPFPSRNRASFLATSAAFLTA